VHASLLLSCNFYILQNRQEYHRCKVDQGQLPCCPLRKTSDSSKTCSWKSSNSGSSTVFPNTKHTIDQINTMQQTIVMYEFMNRKGDEFGRNNHQKWSSRSIDMGSGSFQRQNDLFRRFWGNSGIFGVVGGSWHKIQGLLPILGIFQEFL
jgi:hypothetical protein